MSINLDREIIESFNGETVDDFCIQIKPFTFDQEVIMIDIWGGDELYIELEPLIKELCIHKPELIRKYLYSS